MRTAEDRRDTLLTTLIAILKSLGLCPVGLGWLTLSANSRR